MKDIIQERYNIELGEEIYHSGLHGFKGRDGYYILIPEPPTTDEEAYEQRSLCEYLANQGFQNVAIPLFTTEGRLQTSLDNQTFSLIYTPSFDTVQEKQGTKLARFHQLGNDYPYQPQYVSRYGQWKTLWEDKMDAWTSLYEQEWEERPATSYQRLFIETFPYLEGMTENAIQYLQESEQDWRYDQTDQGTFTFQRLHPSMLSENIWPHTLLYDHPTRDIAEWMRYKFLEKGFEAFGEIQTFLDDYESSRTLSVFSWRMIYARLLLPVHLFDSLEGALGKGDKRNRMAEQSLRDLLHYQETYEQILYRFFAELSLDVQRVNIPVLDWD
ncbi:spore coat putative kinase YutH [Pontibacillus marinus]|uniref:Spore coat protein YutH n=1 Tax=Pontibacillus marinus BH030004 = DSM 16465 TaxID=1385511 RepID=A0A0A5I1T3_9BACI|nr:spore coat protein YutH [Pontibacillus marinus]KGX89817.1 hypothetical protein N783_04155 [Pontibacillus marinus BH030004 = DSM 16465]